MTRYVHSLNTSARTFFRKPETSGCTLGESCERRCTTRRRRYAFRCPLSE